MPANRKKVPLMNILLLLVAVGASLATLVSSGHSGQSWTRAQWLGDSQRIVVTIEPVGDRLDAFDYAGRLYLDLEMWDVLENSAHEVTWALSMDLGDSETFDLAGGFTFDDYSGQEDERGLYGNISTRVGPLCSDTDDATSDCIPCFIEQGCTLNIDVDLCYVGNDEEIGIGISIAQSDGEIFYNECAEGDDVEPCEVLDAWVQAEPEVLTSDLCDE